MRQAVSHVQVQRLQVLVRWPLDRDSSRRQAGEPWEARMKHELGSFTDYICSRHLPEDGRAQASVI